MHRCQLLTVEAVGTVIDIAAAVERSVDTAAAVGIRVTRVGCAARDRLDLVPVHQEAATLCAFSPAVVLGCAVWVWFQVHCLIDIIGGRREH